MNTPWQKYANCAGEDPMIFTYENSYVPSRGPSPQQWLKMDEARKFCNNCAVADECYASADAENLRWMIFGGRFPETTQRVKGGDSPLTSEERVLKYLARGICSGKHGPHMLKSREDLSVRAHGTHGIQIACRACEVVYRKEHRENRRQKEKERRLLRKQIAATMEA